MHLRPDVSAKMASLGRSKTPLKVSTSRVNGRTGGVIAWYEAPGARLVTTRRKWSAIVTMTTPSHLLIVNSDGNTFLEANVPSAGDACAMAELLLRRNT